ncbi:MAG TPA: NAD-dependent deacylase [Dehalococcoidia bacterium]|nr:NAD-dependent deacylase [Dehalococcoidia bacterium]
MRELIDRAAIELINSRYAIVLTGAGMSTESGIPDFRGPKGIWTTNKEAEAKAYERYELFLRSPQAYWEEMLGGEGTHGAFYREVRKAEPNTGHYALAELEKLGIVKCVITQNIDGLHRKAGTSNVIEYHGSVHKLRCPSCGSRCGFEVLAPEKLPPYCQCGGVMKYDVVHFKEPIPFDVIEQAEREALECDLMLICGTSAVVYPFASLPRAAKPSYASSTTVIEINAEPTQLTHEGISDYLIQGKTGEILPQIADSIKMKVQQNR